MSSMTDFFENKVIDHLLRNQSYTPPATVYLALFTTATTDAGGGTEVTGGSYARQACALSAASGGASSNSSTISFTNMPACTVTHAALMDASTSGNMLLHGALAASKTVSAGETLSFAAGDVDVVMT